MRVAAVIRFISSPVLKFSTTALTPSETLITSFPFKTSTNKVLPPVKLIVSSPNPPLIVTSEAELLSPPVKLIMSSPFPPFISTFEAEFIIESFPSPPFIVTLSPELRIESFPSPPLIKTPSA